MTAKDALRPTTRNRLIDLVRAVGVDVSDWKNFKRGAEWEAANPKYCYEWSFVEPGRVVVLNLWHANLDERRGTVSATMNMREASTRLAARGAKANWIRRAQKMDEALLTAVRDKLTVRVIINDGTQTDGTVTPNAKPSVVERRELDPVAWVISYDIKNGECLLVRGPEVTTIDQFDLRPPDLPDPERVDIHGRAFVRSAAVRRAVLDRANGRCEFCGQPGFVTLGGAVFLETHHIVPLSENGADVVSNSAAVCANHHREAHFGADAALIRARLLAVAKGTMRR